MHGVFQQESRHTVAGPWRGWDVAGNRCWLFRSPDVMTNVFSCRHTSKPASRRETFQKIRLETQHVTNPLISHPQ